MPQQNPGAPQISENEADQRTYEPGDTFEPGGGAYQPRSGTGISGTGASGTGMSGRGTGRPQDPASQAGPNGRTAGPSLSNGALLQNPQGLLQRWESVQVGFVDNPQEAVGDAEQLVSSAIDEIADLFRRQRENLERSWTEGREPSTDDLRAAFQSYRDFFGRLLQV
jgi:hypothetical protein